MPPMGQLLHCLQLWPSLGFFCAFLGVSCACGAGWMKASWIVEICTAAALFYVPPVRIAFVIALGFLFSPSLQPRNSATDPTSLQQLWRTKSNMHTAALESPNQHRFKFHPAQTGMDVWMPGILQIVVTAQVLAYTTSLELSQRVLRADRSLGPHARASPRSRRKAWTRHYHRPLRRGICSAHWTSWALKQS